MKFKVGDKVRVRSLLSLVAEFGGSSEDIQLPWDSMNKTMLRLCGKEVTIAEVTDANNYLIDQSPWYWYDCCFEDRALLNLSDFQIPQISISKIQETLCDLSTPNCREEGCENCMFSVRNLTAFEQYYKEHSAEIFNNIK